MEPTLTRAVELYRCGHSADAERLCNAVLRLAPDDADALSLLGEILLANGEPARAAHALERLIALRPLDAAAQRRLATAWLETGRAADAARVLRTAIDLEPRSVRAHNNLGKALLQLGAVADAIACFEAALELDARHALAHHNLGLALRASGDLERAQAAFERALALEPRLFDAWVSRGAVLTELRRFEAALRCLDGALALRPGDAEALYGKAAALRKLNRLAEALGALDALLTSTPAHVGGWCARGLVAHEMGEDDAARGAYRRALELDREFVLARTRLLAAMIPSVPASELEATDARREFDAELSRWEGWQAARQFAAEDAQTIARQQFFYLSYDEESNKPLLQRYRRVSAALLAATDHAKITQRPPGPYSRGGRFRLGFASAHVFDHSVYTALLEGWLDGLDRSRFEIQVFSVGTHRDALTQAASRAVDRFEADARSVAAWARLIRAQELDALVYPEIGMNETILTLASLRLAPRQLAAWGHPETSALPTIDEFLSGDLFEPADAQEHYSERLIRLPNLGVACRPHDVETVPFDRAALKIPAHGLVLICPGVPFKYRPQDDWMLIQIARRLGRCTLVFFEHEKIYLSHKLRARLHGAFAAAGLDAARYLEFIPWQRRDAFFALLRQADLYLDTTGFSGFNSLLQAVQCGLPCVTYEGRFLRGRLGSGILRRLGLRELIASNRDDYVDLVVRLAADADRRAAIRARMQHAAPALYADRTAIDALAELLLHG
jgi:predicted O-linked N-acetylglucosamine transferase (SPINDLY family)